MFQEVSIQEKAAALLAETGLEGNFPLPVEKVVQHLGFECHFYIPDKDIEDIASAVSYLKRKIYVNQNNSIPQQRFSIARKIGCLVLHGDNQDYIGYLRLTDDPKDKAAETFAQNLLMPEKTFREQWTKTKHDIVAMANFFGVSQFLISSRASSLGLC